MDKENANAPKIPPGKFNLIDRPFRPTWDYEQIEGLKETVQKLHAQGRLRSALDVIFKALERHPNHPQALMLAMIVIDQSRLGRLQAQEPLPLAYMLDRRLDSIFTVCSHCRTTTWVSTNCLLADSVEMSSGSDPAGLQCYTCGYVVCRDCLHKLAPHGEFAPSLTRCLNCGQGKLEVPVYPTGRLPQQMERHAVPVVRVIVFREGPIPPDFEYITKLLEVNSPDALESSATLTGIPLSPWPDDIETWAMSTIVAMESDGEVPTGSAGSTEYAEIRDEHGTRAHIAKVMQPSAEAAEASAKTRKMVVGTFKEATAEGLKKHAIGKGKPGFLKRLFGGTNEKKSEAFELASSGPLASSLRRCSKCGAACLFIGLGAYIFSSEGIDHEHTWKPCSESSVIDAKYNSAEQAYLRAIDLMFEEVPGLLTRNRDARLMWADCLERLARLEGKLPSDSVDLHAYRAFNIYHKVKAHDLAAAELQKAVALDPANPHYRSQMAIQHFLSDNWPTAEKTWIELLQEYPNDEDAISNYAAALSQMVKKDPSRRMEYYRKAVDLLKSRPKGNPPLR